MGLIPQLVAGYGRSGTTALMSLLGTDPRVAMGRAYPFEDRDLTYLSKLAVLLERNLFQPQPSPEHLYAFEDCVFGGIPWEPPEARQNQAGHDRPSAAEWFVRLWAVMVEKTRSRHASAAFYAEKVPAWIPAFVRRNLSVQTFYLFRDPRDMYLSANAFMRQRQYFSFGRRPGDSDFDHARNLAYEFLGYFENYRADKDRPDCMLVQYADLIQHRAKLVDRLRCFSGLECLEEQVAFKELDSHRTSSSPEGSMDRWRREPLPPAVVSFFQTYLQESMVPLGYDPAATQEIRRCPGVEFGRKSKDDNGLRVVFQDKEFSIDLPIESFSSHPVTEIWVCLHGPGIDEVILSWETPQRSARKSLSLPTYGGHHWRVLRFLVARQEGWNGKISKLRLQMSANSSSGEDDTACLRWVRLVE